MSDVSPELGHAPLAAPRVTTAPAHYPTSSIPRITSQFRGPFVYNETEEEKAKREEDEKKRNNFDKVREKAEREEEARKAAEAERDALRKEKSDREAKDKAAADAKLTEEKKFEDLAKQRETEAQAKADEAAREKSRADAAEKELSEFKAAQQNELDDLVAALPEEARKDLPMDDGMTVAQKLRIVKHAKAQIDAKQPDDVGNPVRDRGNQSRQDELKALRKKPFRTPEESARMAELSGEQ